MSILSHLEKHPFTKGATLVVLVADVLGLIGGILMWMNLIPRYEFKRIKSDTVIPLVYFFPAQKVRLSPTFADGTQSDQVKSANWSLKKDMMEKYTADGLEPTISIPGGNGGLYQLEVKVKLSDDTKERSGTTNIYVVQDIPEKVVTKSKVTVPPGTSGFSEKLVTLIKERGLEVYNGSAGWNSIESVNLGAAGIEIPAGTEMAIYEGQTIMRAKGNAKELSNYGTFAVPTASVVSTKSNSLPWAAPTP